MAAINADPALTRVVVYCRVSEDKRRGRSVSQQETELRAECADRGWTVVAVIVDNDVGASSFSKGDRPGWRQVLAMVEAGEVDVIATWEGSRAQRDLEMYVKLRRLCIDSGVRWFYSDRLYDMSNWRDCRDTGRDAVDDEASSGQTSERIRRDVRAAALAGRPHGRVLYGYRRTYDPHTGDLTGQEPSETPVPGPPGTVAVLVCALGGAVTPYTTAPEADVVRRVFSEYLAGKGLKPIAEGLNADGIPTNMGLPWSDRRVADLIDNPSYAGRRHHHGTVMNEEAWSALIEPDTFDRATKRREAHQGTRQKPNARLLSAVARCGVCGSRLAVHARGETCHYECRASAAHVGRRMERLDAFVTGALWARLGRPDVAATLAAANAPDPRVVAARARVVELRARLDEATAQFTADDPAERITASTLARIESELVPRIAEAEREERRAHVPMDIPDLPDDPALIPGWWDRQPMDRRREIAGALIASVTVQSVGRGRRHFDDAEYTRIEWRR